MEIHHYDRATGEYFKTGTARQDPLDRGRYLIPAYATDIQPPATAANETAVFVDGAWGKTPDFRGTKYWIADGTEQEIDGLGEKVPAGATTTPPPSPGKIWGGSAWVDDPDYAAAQLSAARANAEIGRVPFLLAMVSLGVIDNDTALEASDGTWPAAFNPFLAPLTLEEKMTVKSAWRAADTVRLDSPVLATIAAYTQTDEAMVTVTQSDLDTVFGVTA